MQWKTVSSRFWLYILPVFCRLNNNLSNTSAYLIKPFGFRATQILKSTISIMSGEANQEDALKFYHTLRSCKDTYISTHLNTALDALKDSLRLYGPNHVFSSYNGGKDADVIMHLLRAVCAKHREEYQVPCIPKLVYFGIEDEFDEVLSHIHNIEKSYNVEVIRYDCGIIEVNSFFLPCYIYVLFISI